MSLGISLSNARKKQGLSQESIAEKLGVSRQTVSKWELDETTPDIYQAKKLSHFYNLSLDELVEFDIDVKEIEEVIEKTSQEVQDKVDWTKVWAKQYPILATYKETVDIKKYSKELSIMIDDIQKEYKYNYLDAFLVLKDILAQNWEANKE